MLDKEYTETGTVECIIKTKCIDGMEPLVCLNEKETVIVQRRSIHSNKLMKKLCQPANNQLEHRKNFTNLPTTNLHTEKTFDNSNPINAKEIRKNGLAHVPEDRQRMGLVTSFSANESCFYISGVVNSCRNSVFQ